MIWFAPSASAQVQVLDEIAARVGDEVILLSDVEQQYAFIREQQGKKTSPDLKCMILEGLIAQNLLVHQARLDSIKVTDEEVHSQIKQRMDDILRMMGGDPVQFKQYYGKTVEEQSAEMFDLMKNKILAERMQDKVINSIHVTPDEVQAFFKEIPRDSLPFYNAEVEVSHITYQPQPNAVEKEKARNLALDLLNKLKNNAATFEDLARKYSNDLGSAKQGGDLGWQKRGVFVPEFEAAAYNLNKDEISNPVETEFGFHIIQTLERRGNLIKCRHILIQPDITDADLKAAERVCDSVRTLIMEGKATFGDMVKKVSDPNNQSYHNNGRMLNPKSGNTFFETGDLDPATFFSIDTLKVGGITKPIRAQGNGSQMYYQLIRLDSRSKPHQASIETDYARISEACISQKKQKSMAEWVADHVENTYISLGPRYRDCPNMAPYLTTEN
jgi:peptidyl-prolyl cis-trans isomerase SurA